jgi:hypothetical protein
MHSPHTTSVTAAANALIAAAILSLWSQNPFPLYVSAKSMDSCVADD